MASTVPPLCLLFAFAAASWQCEGIFSVFVLLKSEDCAEVFASRLIAQLEAAANQLDRLDVAADIKMTVYVTADYYDKSDASMVQCLSELHSSSPSSLTPSSYQSWQRRVDVVKLDQMVLYDNSSSLLTQVAIDELRSWPSSIANAAYKSNILRLLIARQTNSLYVDLDVILLGTSVLPFLTPFASLTVHHSHRSSGGGEEDRQEKYVPSLSRISKERVAAAAARYHLGLTSSAFCLPLNVISDLVRHQASLISMLSISTKNSGGGGSRLATSFYEFGDGTFRSVLLQPPKDLSNRISFFSTNAPRDYSPTSIAEQVEQYGHQLLHLPGIHSQAAAKTAGGFQLYYKNFIFEVLDAISVKNSTRDNNDFPGIVATTAKEQGPVAGDATSSSHHPVCHAGIFTTLDSVLAGPNRAKRADCCYEMREGYFKLLVTEAVRQAWMLGTSLLIVTTDDKTASRCGHCFDGLFQSWASPMTSSPAPISSLLQEPLNSADTHWADKSSELLRAAIETRVLRKESFATESLLAECGLIDAAVVTPFLQVAAASYARSAPKVFDVRASPVTASTSASSSNTTYFPNTIANEAVEAMTTLCLARRHSRAHVALNTLILPVPSTPPSFNLTSSTATPGAAKFFTLPYLALATSHGHATSGGADSFVSGTTFCAPGDVLTRAALHILSTQNLLRLKEQERKGTLRRRMQQQKPPPKMKFQPKKKFPTLKKPPPQDTTVPETYLQTTALDVDMHETLLSDALLTTWLRLSNSGAAQGLQLLSMAPPHIVHLPKLQAEITTNAPQFALVTPALFENSLRNRVHDVTLAQRRRSGTNNKNSVIQMSLKEMAQLKQVVAAAASPLDVMQSVIRAIRSSYKESRAESKL